MPPTSSRHPGTATRQHRPDAPPTPADALAAVLPFPAPSLGDRPLFLDEVHARLPKRPDGSPRFSRTWARHHVAPEAKRRAGKFVYWLERDVVAWERRWFAGDRAADEQQHASEHPSM